MLSESSNPHADKLFAMLAHLQKLDRFEIKVVPATPSRTRKGAARPRAS
jgi:hypothetical protein